MTPYKSIGLYQITYQNGITQQKHLIKQSDYLDYIDINKTLALMTETKKSQDKFKNEIMNLKVKLKNDFGGNFFTTESPLGLAIKTGILCLPKIQGGCSVVKIVKL